MNIFEQDVELAKTLRYIALNPDSTLYKIGRESGVNRITVVRKIKQQYNLVSEGVLTMKHGKRNSEKFSLTLEGLLSLLLFDRDIWKKIDLVAAKNQKKLLTFKKWDFFRREKLTETIVRTLRRTLGSLYATKLSLAVFSARVKYTKKEQQKIVDSMTLGCYALRDLKWSRDKKLFADYLRILEACKKDKELNRFVLEELNLFKKRAAHQLVAVERGLEMINSVVLRGEESELHVHINEDET